MYEQIRNKKKKYQRRGRESGEKWIGYCRYEEETEISNRNAPVIFTATFLVLINHGWIWNQGRNESVGKRRHEGIAL